MKLMTEEIEKAFERFPMYSQDGLDGDALVVAKFFGGSAATWLITEGEKQPNGDWLLFGFVTLGLRDDFHPSCLLWEWGDVMLSDLESLKFPPFGLPVERDVLVKPGVSRVRDEVFMCHQYGGM